MRAATSAATARLVCRCVPNRWLPLTSTARSTVSSRSSTNRLMNGVPIRAVTFQSMERTSSPGWYSRTSSNDSPVPLKTEWYSPPRRVCTARRARSWRRRICRITSAGSMVTSATGPFRGSIFGITFIFNSPEAISSAK